MIGHLPMVSVTAEDCRALVAKLDDAVIAETISWKTACNVWGEVTSAFRQACSSKDPALRVRPDNDDPTKGVQGPTRGESKEKPILYPDEAIALLSCERVPLYWRRMYAVAIYTGARSNEIAALRASDVDLVHGQITITKQVDRKTGSDRRTKTRRSRTIEVEPKLIPLLRVLVENADAGGRLVRMPPDEDRAELLRTHLARAGVKREALYVTDDPSRARIKFHNLRDTCLTWMAVRGDAGDRIQWRGGHTDLKTTQGYTLAGKNLRGAVGAPFPSLPASLLVANTTGDTPEGTSSAAEDDDPMVPGMVTPKRRKPSHRIDERASVVTPTGLEPVLPA